MKKNRMEELTDAEFLSFLYSEREREENLNSYQGWNLWATVGAMITVACTAYNIICAHTGEIDRLRIIYLTSYYLGSIWGFWYSFIFFMSFLKRKRAKDYKRIKHLKDVAPIPYFIVSTVCAVEFALCFLLVECDNRWNTISISWMVLAVCLLLISIHVYVKRNAIVWAVRDDIWFVRKWVMFTVGLFVFVVYWLIWKWSRENISGPFFGTPEFELAVCITAFTVLVDLCLFTKLKNRRSSEIDVLIDEFLYKGKLKEEVYSQLRANQMGYGIFEACKQERDALKKYSDDFDSHKKTLEELRASFENGDISVDCVVERFESLKESFEYNDEWANRVDALCDKLDEIGKNVPELKDEEEFVNLYEDAGRMLKRSKVMYNEIKSLTDEFQKFFEEHCKEVNE